MKFNVHAGHAPYGIGGAHGAIGFLNESKENRLVKDKVIELLKTNGHEVYDCTCDLALSKNEVLNHIVKKCNMNKVDYDISIHLNSGRNDKSGDGFSGGVEVYGFDKNVRCICEKISENISNELHIRNRGFKIDKSLYVLKKTKSPAILIECCFVDDKDDMLMWNADKCAEAIANTFGMGKSSTYPHYISHIQSIGWDKEKCVGEVSGTTGKSLRLEGFKIDWPGHIIKAKAHVENIGDIDYGVIDSNTLIGTEKLAKRLEAIYLEGPIQVRIHEQDKGWSKWTNMSKGVWLGTKHEKRRIEAIQIKRL